MGGAGHACFARSAGLLVCLVGLACAPSLRAVSVEDSIAGKPALDTSYRVKDLVTVPGPETREYVLPIGEYRPKHADDEGIFYAAPGGVLERAGFSKRAVAGGIYVANAPGRPYERPLLYVERDGDVEKLPLPPVVLRGYGRALAFAVDGEELIP
jgi:hypothetical protein